jgi:uncharacterized protein with HEPN domain
VALRNVVVHNCDDVDYTRYWNVIRYELPRLGEELEKMACDGRVRSFI